MGSRRTSNDAGVHRALGSVSRARILELLHTAAGAMSASDVADLVGLHVSTVREHLETLVRVGLATKTTDEPSGRGRPRQLYSAQRLAPERARTAGYELLAAVLVDHLRDSASEPASSAEAAGRKASEHLIDEIPFAGLPHAEVLRRVTDLMADLGFDPELVVSEADPRSARILLRRCPFEELARANTEIVCGVHLGMIRGALRELGAADAAATLEPFVEPQLCVIQLAVPGDSAAPPT